MEDVSVKIGGKVFILELAETDEDKYDGLSTYDDIPDNEGMIFIYLEPGPHPMVMRGMEFAIDILHLDSEGIVDMVATGNPGDTFEYEGGTDSRYVIEIPANKVSVKVGDRVNIPASLTQYLADKHAVGMARKGSKVPKGAKETVKVYDVKTTDIPEHSDHMQVLDHEGKVISNIKEGARIFSRQHTKQLVEAAHGGEDDESLKKLGMMVVGMIHKQDTQKPEYST